MVMGSLCKAISKVTILVLADTRTKMRRSYAGFEKDLRFEKFQGPNLVR